MGVHYSLQYKKPKKEYTKNDELLVYVKYIKKTLNLSLYLSLFCNMEQKKNPNSLINRLLGFSLGGPTWARTRDQLIMSQLL